MSSSSDTESDTGDFATASSAPPTSLPGKSHDHGLSVTQRDMDRAIQVISTVNVDTVKQDTSVHDDICSASNTILSILSEIVQPTQGDDLRCLNDFITLVHVSFLSTLFAHRKKFHEIAAQDYEAEARGSTIVSWVDVILVHFSDAIVAVAGGFNLRSHKLVSFDSLRRQRQDDILRAAAQLPRDWSSTVLVLRSERASPAAKRLVLRLLFAVYVIVPQFQDYDPWNAGDISPSVMIGILDVFIHQLHLHDYTPKNLSEDLYEQDRVSFAMTVSLYAATELKYQDLSQGGVLPPFRPRTSAALLQMIQLIMQPNHSQSPVTFLHPFLTLDTSKAILVKWGDTVPWCWAPWKDQRLANADSVTSLTATWFYHLDIQLFVEAIEDTHNQKEWSTTLYSYLARDWASSSAIIHCWLLDVVSSFCSPVYLPTADLSSAMIDVLIKICWATVQLINFDKQAVSIELYKCLCCLFVLLDDQEGELRVKSLVIEALTLLEPTKLHETLKSIQQNSATNFTRRLDDLITRSKQRIVNYGDALDERNISAIKLTLDFITVLWGSNTLGGLHRQTVSSFLAVLVNLLEHEDSSAPPFNALLGSLMMALSAREAVKDEKLSLREDWQNSQLWQLAVQCGRTDLAIASSFSRYILASSTLCDTLSCVEACAYLRDVLLMILTRRYHGCSGELAWPVAVISCQAIMHLIAEVDAVIAQYIISSPWMKNLIQALEDFSNGEQPSGNICLLRRVATQLLNQILRNLRPSKAAQTDIQKGSQSHLCYVRIDNISHLLPVGPQGLVVGPESSTQMPL